MFKCTQTASPHIFLGRWKAANPCQSLDIAYVTGVLVALSGAWVKVRFSDFHAEISGDLGVRRLCLTLVTATGGDSSVSPAPTISQGVALANANILRELLEGDEDEDCGDDDPPTEAFADDYPVHAGWTPAEVIQCQRTQDGKGHVRPWRMKLGISPESFTPFVFFKAFLPKAFLLSYLEAMNVAVADSNCKDCPPFIVPELLVFLGLLIHASRFPFCTHEELWGSENTLNHQVSCSFTFRSVMSATRFRQWKRFF
jgi:hypothetical protein